MRYVTFLLIPPDGALHPIEEAVAREPGLSRKAIHQFRVLEDGTAVTLYELVGDEAAAEAVLSDNSDVVSWDVSSAGDSLFCHVHFRPNELTADVFDIPRQHELVIDTPMRYTDRGALRVTAIGELDTVRTAIREMPVEIGLRLLHTGEYAPDADALYEQLTARQQAVLQAAVAVGYYEEPRKVTLEAVADELDISAGTAGEHLRKVESTVLKRIVP